MFLSTPSRKEGQSPIEIEDLCATPFEQLASLEIQAAVHGALQQIPDVFRKCRDFA